LVSTVLLAAGFVTIFRLDLLLSNVLVFSLHSSPCLVVFLRVLSYIHYSSQCLNFIQRERVKGKI